jgi:hypothetical protein
MVVNGMYRECKMGMMTGTKTMNQRQLELAIKAQECGYTLVKEPKRPYYLRGWEGNTVGPFTPKELDIWLAGYSRGMNNHAPDCDCGRLACNFRKLHRS